MASFSDLVRAQRQSGRGVVTSLSGAYNQMNLQRYDPRNALFSKGGIMTSLFPGLKGYQASPVSGKSPSSMISPEISSSPTALNSIARDARISARNSMALPSIARNMAQMVRIWGGTPAKYFEKAREKETAYESKYGGPKKGLPGLGKSIGGGGFNIMGMLGGALGSIGSVAGSILGGIGNLLGGAASGIFGVLSSALGGMGFMGVLAAGAIGFVLYQIWKNLDFSKLKEKLGLETVFSNLGSAIDGLIKEIDGMTGGGLSTFLNDVKNTFNNVANKTIAALQTGMQIMTNIGTAILQDFIGYLKNFYNENKGLIFASMAIGAMGPGALSSLKGAALTALVAGIAGGYGMLSKEDTPKTLQEKIDAENARIAESQKRLANPNLATTEKQKQDIKDEIEARKNRIAQYEALKKEKEEDTKHTQRALDQATNFGSMYEQNLSQRQYATSPTPAGVSQFMGKGSASFIASMEGFAGKAYLDPPGNTKNQYSIGHGHLITAHEIKQGYINLGNGKKIAVRGPGGKDTTITKEEAQALLSTDIPKYEKIASDAIGADAWQKLSEDQRSALTSLAYNAPGNLPVLVKAGLRDAIMQGDTATASKIIYEKGWKTAQGKYLAGLDERRKKEASLFGSGVTDGNTQLASAQKPSASRIPRKETPQPSAADSAAAFAADQIMALDKMMGGQLLKGSSQLADMLRDITREFMNNPTFVDSSQTVNNNQPGLTAATTGGGYSVMNPDAVALMVDRSTYHYAPYRT